MEIDTESIDAKALKGKITGKVDATIQVRLSVFGVGTWVTIWEVKDGAFSIDIDNTAGVPADQRNKLVGELNKTVTVPAAKAYVTDVGATYHQDPEDFPATPSFLDVKVDFAMKDVKVEVKAYGPDGLC